MELKKYRPAFFEGFDDVYYTVNSKHELLSSDLCKSWIDDGFEICISDDLIMAVSKPKENKWYVISIVNNAKDIETLNSWLPKWELK